MFRPAFEGQVCSLGYEAIDWIVENCCYGPGDLQGEHPVVIDDEIFDFIVDAYALDPGSGRRIYDEGVLSRPKGRAKTEIAGWLVCFEAFGPARFSHWDGDGQPVGKHVTSPLIKCLATEESQATAAFSVVAYIVNDWGKENRPDVYGASSGVRQYQSATAIYLPHGGEIRASTSGSASKDGGKETFVVADETHLYVLRELKAMYGTIRRNLGKRKLAEPWLMQTSTAYRPGEESIFEETLTSWRKGTLSRSVYVNHREARGKVDVADQEHTLKQLRYVYGPAAEWMDLDRIYREMLDPRSCRDEAEAARYFLNRPMSGQDAWIAKAIHDRQERPGEKVAPGEAIAVGFDGSLNNDSTVLRGCRMSDGFLFKIGVWEKPEGPAGEGWQVDRSDVLSAIYKAHADYDVVRGYYDPHEWRSDIDALADALGDVVVSFPTSQYKAMNEALDRLHTGLKTGEIWHDADPVASEHYGNAYKAPRGAMTLVRKENPNSARKIDSVVGDALALQARADAVTDGWTAEPKTTYFRLPR